MIICFYSCDKANESKVDENYTQLEQILEDKSTSVCELHKLIVEMEANSRNAAGEMFSQTDSFNQYNDYKEKLRIEGMNKIISDYNIDEDIYILVIVLADKHCVS